MLYKDKLYAGGLLDRDAELIQRTLWAFPEVDKLVLYGSRAKGNFMRSSDVDLAIYGKDVTERLSWQFQNVLFEGLSLFRLVDVVAPDHLPNPRLVEEIEKYGVVLYEKERNE